MTFQSIIELHIIRKQINTFKMNIISLKQYNKSSYTVYG